MANQTTERTNQFQHLVLLGLWVILLSLHKQTSYNKLKDYREGAIRFGDAYGVKGDDAKKARRETYSWW